MRFAYYNRLTPTKKKIYLASDAIEEIRLPAALGLQPLAASVHTALASENQPRTQEATARLIAGLHLQLRVPAVEVIVLARRPSRDWGELHGLYEFGGRLAQPRITLWMRTAQRKQVVAFRTFLRTVLHEVGHHLDYHLLKLRDSFHTEGFYKRESSLFRQLVLEAAPATSPREEE
jgi:hypothetical protein